MVWTCSELTREIKDRQVVQQCLCNTGKDIAKHGNYYASSRNSALSKRGERT